MIDHPPARKDVREDSCPCCGAHADDTHVWKGDSWACCDICKCEWKPSRRVSPNRDAASQPVAGVEFVRELQQRCVNWNAYWRAPDAHGVDLTIEQATDLLRDVLSVEVKIAAPPKAEPAGWVLVPREPTEEMILAFAETWFKKRRCIDDPEFDDAYAAMIQAAPAHDAAGAGKDAARTRTEPPPCKDHPDAPHGYNRNASHSMNRYVCDCEWWEPEGGS